MQWRSSTNGPYLRPSARRSPNWAAVARSSRYIQNRCTLSGERDVICLTRPFLPEARVYAHRNVAISAAQRRTRGDLSPRVDDARGLSW